MATSNKPLLDKQGAKEPTAEKNCDPMLPSLQGLAKHLFDKYEDGRTKLLDDHKENENHEKRDGLSLLDSANRAWISTIQQEYMKMLKPEGFMGKPSQAWSGFYSSDRLTATLTATEQMLAWVIAHPKFESMLNEHRYIIDNLVEMKSASNVDKTTVHLLSVFGLMTLVVAPVDGVSTDLEKGNTYVQKGRLKLQNKGDSSKDVEAAHGMRLMGVDRMWFVDDIQTHATYIQELSQHLKSWKPASNHVWLESRTMVFFANFLTMLVSELREQVKMAQAMQAKIIGSFCTGAFAVINILLQQVEGGSQPP